MHNEPALPFEQNQHNLRTFGFALLSNAAIFHLSQQDMMDPENALSFHLSVEDHCKYDQNQWEWQQ